MRLDRRLANLGYGSRREVRDLVRCGRVSVDGCVVHDATAPATGTLAIDGHAVDDPLRLLVALHKPVGYVTSHSDREGRPVYDLLPPRWQRRRPRPTAVGRLDKDSSGLLLITDRMELVHELTAPRHHVDKRYEVRLDRTPGDDADRLRSAFESGTLRLPGESTPCRPAGFAALPDGRVEVWLHEGRHRQVRRMFAALGYDVVALHRTQVGPYALADLPVGEWRYLSS